MAKGDPCDLCGSTWGDVDQEIGGRRYHFC
ncbi:hypothetical protein EPN29_14195 [bacterium]|nr:MAG: hypothetical protein EPN29_14195 [bacterium]